jgi:hypothetical protein
MKTFTLLFWLAVTLIGFGYFFVWIGSFLAAPFMLIFALGWLVTSAGSRSSSQ